MYKTVNVGQIRVSDENRHILRVIFAPLWTADSTIDTHYDVHQDLNVKFEAVDTTQDHHSLKL